MDNNGKRVLERALGHITYRHLIQELSKNHYSESDVVELANILQLHDFYEELKERDDVPFKNCQNPNSTTTQLNIT